MRKGDIVLVAFPFTDLLGAKVRPALVLWAAQKGEDFMAAFITSEMKGKKRIGAHHDVRAHPSAANGLKKVSQIRLDKLATLQKKSALGKLGSLEPALQKETDAVLRKLLGL